MQKTDYMKMEDPEDQAVEIDEQGEMPAKRSRAEPASMTVDVDADDKIC